jgi:hypothetical protein
MSNKFQQWISSRLAVPSVSMLRARLAVLLLLLMSPLFAHAATITISPGPDLQSTINRAVAGDTIVLADGTYSGGANFDGKVNLTVTAANIGQAILEGGQVLGGTHITLRGVVVQNVVTGIGSGAVMVGSGWRLEDVVIQDNETIGLDIHEAQDFTALRVKCLHNGTIGISSGGRDDRQIWCKNITLTDVECAYNNYGMDDPSWKTQDKGKVTQKNGKWFRIPGDAAGGAKLCVTGDLVIERFKAHHNGGPGLWFDVYNGKETIRNSECFANFGVTSDWEGCGFAVEISNGPTTYENCYGHDNSGSDFAIWESRNVTLRNCIAAGNGVELRNIGGDRGKHWWCQNVTFDGLKLFGTAKINYWANQTPAVRWQDKLIERKVERNLAGIPEWKSQ